MMVKIPILRLCLTICVLSVVFQQIDACTNRTPCLNGGSCHDYVLGHGICTCANGFIGQHCQTHEGHVCANNPCKNGGDHCRIENGHPHCTCYHGYTGNLCEVDPCASNPCQNDGSCTRHSSSPSHICHCHHHYYGDNCEYPICHQFLDPICQNGGSCHHENGCKCAAGFSGYYCEHPDVCHPNPCQNGGDCIITVQGHHCACHNGYTGDHCENHVAPTRTSTPTSTTTPKPTSTTITAATTTTSTTTITAATTTNALPTSLCEDDPSYTCSGYTPDMQALMCSSPDYAIYCRRTCGDCVWSNWYYGQCSVSCGTGTTDGVRVCSSGHVEDCTGSASGTFQCQEQPCQGTSQLVGRRARRAMMK